MNTVEDFIANYTGADRPRIDFAWNGKHMAEFEDANQAFRWEVIKTCLAAPDTASPLLLAHLFEADAAWSREAWGAPFHFAELGSALLARGREEFLISFANNFGMSFDTFAASHELRVAPELLSHLMQYIEETLGNTSDAAHRKPLELALDLFAKLKTANAMDGWYTIAPGTPVSDVKVVWPHWYHRIWSRIVAFCKRD